jgi:hypothetical protein
MSERAAVYRLFDSSDALLYVGCSQGPDGRAKWHRRHQPWGTDIARHDATWHESRIEALRAEAAAISHESPIHNVVRVPVDRESYFQRVSAIDYSGGRPATGETPVQHIRIPDEDWQAFIAVTGGKGAAVIRAFIAWYLWRKGSRRPIRPPRG